MPPYSAFSCVVSMYSYNPFYQACIPWFALLRITARPWCQLARLLNGWDYLRPLNERIPGRVKSLLCFEGFKYLSFGFRQGLDFDYRLLGFCLGIYTDSDRCTMSK